MRKLLAVAVASIATAACLSSAQAVSAKSTAAKTASDVPLLYHATGSFTTVGNKLKIDVSITNHSDHAIGHFKLYTSETTGVLIDPDPNLLTPSGVTWKLVKNYPYKDVRPWGLDYKGSLGSGQTIHFIYTYPKKVLKTQVIVAIWCQNAGATTVWYGRK